MSNEQKAKYKVSVEGLESLKAAVAGVLEAIESLEYALKALDECKVTIHTSPLAAEDEH